MEGKGKLNLQDYEYQLTVSVLCTKEEATVVHTLLHDFFSTADIKEKDGKKQPAGNENREIAWDIGIITDYIPQMIGISELMPKKIICAKTVCNDGLFYEYFKNGKIVGSTKSLTPDQIEYWSDPVFDLNNIFQS